MNNRLNNTPGTSDRDAEAEKDKLLEEARKQFEAASFGGESEAGKLKLYLGTLVEMLNDGSLNNPAVQAIQGASEMLAQIGRVNQTSMFTAVFFDFDIEYYPDAFISLKRKKFQVFYERVSEILEGGEESAETPDEQEGPVMQPDAAKSELESASAEKLEALEKLKESQNRIGELEKQIAELERQLAEKNETHQGEIGVLEEKLGQEYEAKAVLTEKLGKLEAELAESKESVRSLSQELLRVTKDVDRARQAAFSSPSFALPDSQEGEIVKENLELKAKVSELEGVITSMEALGSSFDVELLISEVERYKEALAERDRLPAPNIGTIADAVRAKDRAETELSRSQGTAFGKDHRIAELEEELRLEIIGRQAAEKEKRELEFNFAQGADAHESEKRDLEEEIGRLQETIRQSVTGSAVPPAPGSVAALQTENAEKDQKIQSLEAELGILEGGNEFLNERNKALAEEVANLKKQLAEATGTPPASPPPPTDIHTGKRVRDIIDTLFSYGMDDE